ncbi:MAG: hypothetical protein ACD_20C00234G0015 [uncultured bacterium]|nr:MAG: hypothetical protein ACD_20C00234G0015 [uncultured bacterium]HBH18782.1 hypothetical protein [Cyanobacteria bacterium UBA9579]
MAYGAASITKAIKGADFPCSKQDLINSYGDKEVEYTKGNPQKLRNILNELPSDSYNSPADLEHDVHEVMG